MAKVAVFEPSSSNSFPFGRAQTAVTMKRKTPSELRGEQLKRRNCEMLSDEQIAPSLASDRITGGMIRALKKSEPSKNPKYINTRVDEVYAVKKSSDRCRILYGKEKAKEPSTTSENVNNLIRPSGSCNFVARSESSVLCGKTRTVNISEALDPFVKDNGTQVFQKIEKCSQNTFRSVAELSLGSERFSGAANINMDKALKGLVSREFSATSGLADSSGRFGDLPSISSSSFLSEFHLMGHKAPFDLTLKTTLRLVSSSSVKWIHRLSASTANSGIHQFTSRFSCTPDQNLGSKLGLDQTADALFSKALHSWAYPQSSLPSSVVSALSLSAAKGETDFFVKRQQEWEDSFRSLYYMLRKKLCNIFYVYTSQFVVLFVGGNFLGKERHSCNAYLSQSTRGLRSLLRDHEICFTMPLCHAEVEQPSEADLDELSEIQKRNLGQTLHLDSLSDVDSSPQSLLAFIGNENVHGLYDFLLNYRFFLNSLAGVDVPVLYSPVPFQNASLCVPEVRCKEMKRADVVLPSPNSSGSDDTETVPGLSAGGICYSIEIKDTILPPWVVCGVCVAMGSEGRSFEASFTTDPASIGLNVALDSVCEKTKPLMGSNKCSPESGNAFGIPEAVLTPYLHSASLKRLKYSKGSYMALVIPV